MEPIQYIGEHLLPGQLGQFALFAGFTGSLLAAFAWFMAVQRRERPEAATWNKIGQWSFGVHSVGILSVIGVIFYLMINKYYEYQYVQAHVSDDLPMKYIFSAFWEGQEGSFLLWMFWHIVLGLILVFRPGRFTAPVMSMLSLVQVFIGSMILGVYIGLGDDPFKLGSNPLLLLRDTVQAPIFSNANYVSLLQGTGLNPLLQNYWMTIHPPTLFLGFASTTLPFCFAAAGLWLKDYQGWVKAVLPWALFSGAILGLGILMGGAWAYEALTFGGYWAWDPVENMSLVPWLILVAGVHANLIAKNTRHGIRSTYVYYALTFVLILYSTFLTRSGVLGDTSVHAFTEMGLEAQLLAFMAAFAAIAAIQLGLHYTRIPVPEKEEATGSREFWMFIGTLILLFSGLIITGSTSLPVYNKIRQFFDPAYLGSVITDPIPHYNKYQIWIAVFISMFSGTAQFLRYREPNWAKHAGAFWKHSGISMAVALLLTLLASSWIKGYSWQYSALMFAGLFTVASNLDYLVFFLRGNLKKAGSVVSHVGFGLMIVGILASGLNQRIISTNPFMMDGLIEGAEEDSARRNLLLFKGVPMKVKDYTITFVRDTIDNLTRTYEVNYKRHDDSGTVVEEFNLSPNILYNKDFSAIAAYNPATKHYLDKDIFTHIPALPKVEQDINYRREREDSLNYRPVALIPSLPTVFVDTVKLDDADTFLTRTYTLELQDITRKPQHEDYAPQEGDLAIGATLAVRRSDDDSTYIVNPVVVLRGDFIYAYPHQINELNAKIRIPESIFESYFVQEENLNFENYTLKPGQEIAVEGFRLRLDGFQRDPVHPAYTPEDGDIAVGAKLYVQTATGDNTTLEPVFFIRGNRPFNIKDEWTTKGLSVRFASLDPQTESMQLMVARMPEAGRELSVELATNSLRSDYIVLEAKEFPGINYFWAGSLMMMIGLGLSMTDRMRQK